MKLNFGLDFRRQPSKDLEGNFSKRKKQLMQRALILNTIFRLTSLFWRLALMGNFRLISSALKSNPGNSFPASFICKHKPSKLHKPNHRHVHRRLWCRSAQANETGCTQGLHFVARFVPELSSLGTVFVDRWCLCCKVLLVLAKGAARMQSHFR